MNSSQKLVHPIKLFSHPSYRDYFILQNREKKRFFWWKFENIYSNFHFTDISFIL